MSLTDSTAGLAQQMGQQLRQAREAAGMDVATVAMQLRMQKRLIRALENGDWSQLGAAVFVRGHLLSYARLVGIELTGLEDIVTTPTPAVIPMARIKRGQRLFGKLGTRVVYVVITLLIGVPIWMAAQRHLSPQQPPVALALEIPQSQPATVIPAEAADTRPVPPPPPPPIATASVSGPTTAMAGLSAPAPTIISSPPPAVETEDPVSAVSLHLTQDSWVELRSPDGRNLEQNLLKAGEVRRFARGQLGAVVIGNVEGVELRINGQIQDLSAYRRANVARFAVSSDGVLGPVTH